MRLASQLASIALHSLATAAELAGADGASRLASSLQQLTGDRLGDPSRRLLDALRLATLRAWNALEIALAGDSLRERLRALTGRAEDRAFALQLQTFLTSAAVPPGDEEAVSFQKKALAELRHARDAGLLANDPEAIGPLARYGSPAELLDAQETALSQLAGSLHEQGYVFLARVLLARPPRTQPLLLVAVAYFFRRAVEADDDLFRGLAVERLGQLGEAQEAGFAALELALELQGDRLAGLLADVHATVLETRDAVLDLHGKIAGQNEQLRQIGTAVAQLLEQRQMQRREVRPGDSLSIRSDEESRLVRQLVSRYRALPESERKLVPSLLNAIGKLEVAAGNFDEAQRDFQMVASLVGDDHLRAEAHFNAYRAALERRDWPGAMQSLAGATALDPLRYAPLPLDTYQPEQILGAGGFGVVFLCQHRYMRARLVVKALWLEPFGLEADRVFTEAHLLRQLDHPAIIRITECGYVDPQRRERPYLVMDHFDAPTLEEHVRQQGPVSLDDYLGIARAIAGGLETAHDRGIVHGDVKPANLLARRGTASRSLVAATGRGSSWEVRLIDFGLARRHQLLPTTSLGSTTRSARTLMGQTIAGTLAYAAPEQLGRSSAPIGPQADVYAFGRTSCQLLFGTTQPLPRHWQSIPSRLTDLLGRCLEDDPGKRPAHFTGVLEELEGLAPTAPLVLADEAPARSAAVEVPLPTATPTPPAAVPAFTLDDMGDLEAATSMMELLRHVKRLSALGLFEVAGHPAYPFVRRSEGGGYEAPRQNSPASENVHPVRELVRVVQEQARRGAKVDPRIPVQFAETVKQARLRLKTRPVSLMALGSMASGLILWSLTFGFAMTWFPLNLPTMILAIVFTGVGGVGALVLSVLTLVQLAQRANRNRFCLEVVERLEPLIPGHAGPIEPIVVWPHGPEARSLTRGLVTVLLVSLGLVIAVSVGGAVSCAGPRAAFPGGPARALEVVPKKKDGSGNKGGPLVAPPVGEKP